MENSKNTGWKHKSTNKLSEKQQSKVGKVMHEFKEGELHSGSKKGPIVKERDQAIAIALSEAKSMDKIKRGAVLTPLDVKDGDIFKTINGDMIQVSIINSDKDGKYYILRHHPLNNSKSEKTLLPFEFDRYYKAGLYEKVDPSSLIKKENKMVKGGYIKPGYDVKTTGVYLFKTKKDSFNVVSYLFERENDTEDSLEIQDDLRGNLGSILIQNSAWKRLSSGKPVKASSAYGDYIGTLTRIDDTKNLKKYITGTNNDYSFKGGGGVKERKKPINYKLIIKLIKGADNPINQNMFYSSYSNSIQLYERQNGPQARLTGFNLVNFFRQLQGSSMDILELFKDAAKNPVKTKSKIESLSQNKIYVDISELGWGNEVLVKYKPRFTESDKMKEGGKLTALIEDMKEFDKNIYPKNSDISYKNRLIIANFKTKGYSIIKISKALKVVRNS